MRSPVRTRPSIELIRILLDGEWRTGAYLELAAGKYIPPERASRQRPSHQVESGRTAIVCRALRSFAASGRLEKRNVDGHVEWRLRDGEWARRALAEWESHKPAVVSEGPQRGATPEQPGPQNTTPTTITTAVASHKQKTRMYFKPSVYNALLRAKLTYERSNGGPVEWGEFLMLLLGSAVGAKLITL